MFTIAALEILDGCKPEILKVLNKGFYIFNDRVELKDGTLQMSNEHLSDNFFGRNINIEALVGKNGSGKSSALDLIYRIINNVGAIASWTLIPKKKGQVLPSLVRDIQARIYFTENDSLYWLLCADNNVVIKLDREYDLTKADKRLDKVTIKKIISNLFFTVATNYSVQSFVTRDYEDENCDWKYDEDNNHRVSVFGKPTDWLTGIFHKTDGYISPIVVCPYRDNGILDMNTEEELTEERLMSILLNKRNEDLQLLPEYKLDKVEFNFDITKLYEKYKNATREAETSMSLFYDSKQGNITKESLRKYNAFLRIIRLYGNWKEPGNFMMNFQELLVDVEHKHCYAWEILNACGVNPDCLPGNDLKSWAAAYLVYKTLTIPYKYPSYEKYQDISGLWRYGLIPTEKEKKQLQELVEEIQKEDESHVTVKARQVLNFLQKIDNSDNDSVLNNVFDYDTYLKEINQKQPGDIHSLMVLLPPAIFKPKIILKTNTGGSRPFEQLSSGERQLIYTISTILYHIENIMSINDTKRIQYHNINIVMDEVEITFHPDMQRKFINNLLLLLKEFKVTDKNYVNIIISTHSPFVLSDIPQQNILYLKDGEPYYNIGKNPFGANVNDILAQSFFLDEGFMGEFAQNKIKGIIEELSNATKPLDKDRAQEVEQIIESIGEPLLRQNLTSMFMNVMNMNTDEQIAWLQNQIEFLQSKKHHG